MPSLRYTVLLALAAALSGCSEEPPPPPPPAPTPPKEVKAPVEDTGGPTGSARPRITKLSYSPGRPTTTDHIRLEVKAEDPDGTPVHFKYQWFINEARQVHLKRDNLPAASIERGDVVVCEVTVIDRDGQEAMRKTAEIEIVNSPPVFITDPRQVKKLDGLQLRAEDPDGDKLTFTLTGAPDGMVIDASRGVIKYKGSTKEKGGHYEIEAKADDGSGGTASWRFGIDVSAGSDGQKKTAKAGEAAPADGDKGAEGDESGGKKKRERQRSAW